MLLINFHPSSLANKQVDGCHGLPIFCQHVHSILRLPGIKKGLTWKSAWQCAHPLQVLEAKKYMISDGSVSAPGLCLYAAFERREGGNARARAYGSPYNGPRNKFEILYQPPAFCPSVRIRRAACFCLQHIFFRSHCPALAEKSLLRFWTTFQIPAERRINKREFHLGSVLQHVSLKRPCMCIY